MENVPSNIGDFSNPESTYTAFHRAHPDQQANFNRKMNETAAELCEPSCVVYPGVPYIQFSQRAPIRVPTQPPSQAPAPAPAPAPIPALGATAATAPNPGLVAPTSIPNTNYQPVTTSYSVPMATIQKFAPIAHPQAPATTSVPQPYVTAPAQAQAQAHTINPTVSATVPTPITPQYTHEQAEAEREWVSVGGQWQEAFKRLSMLEIQYRSAEAPQLIAAGVRPDPSRLLSHDGSQQK